MTRSTLNLFLFCTLTCGLVASAQAKDPWSGSTVSFRNTVTAITFDPGAELGYNPYYAMSFGLSPRFWFSEMGYISADLALDREITDSDVTTQAGEWWLTDLSLKVGAAPFYTIPVAEIALSADLRFTLPTSPLSQARTMQIGIAPAVSLTRRFAVLSGITIGYGFRANWMAHRFTTAEKEFALIPNSTGIENGEGLNTGVRNAEWRLIHSLSLGIGFTEWMSLGLSAALVNDYLFDVTLDEEDSGIVEDQDQRFGLSTNISLGFVPHQALTVTVGAAAAHGQQKPDSSQRDPFFNRYTVVYLDLALNIAGLVDSIREEE
ncbi:MAG: hypothetical protein ACI9WU_004345 [Myxococcota bacterium]